MWALPTLDIPRFSDSVMTEQGKGIKSLWNCGVGDLRQRSLELESSQVTGLTPWLLGNAEGSFMAPSAEELVLHVLSAGRRGRNYLLSLTLGFCTASVTKDIPSQADVGCQWEAEKCQF